VAARLLCDWNDAAGLFVKVMPRDYRRALDAQTASGGEPAAVPVIEWANG
jgi:glutamate synthase domain-containing protein 3